METLLKKAGNKSKAKASVRSARDSDEEEGLASKKKKRDARFTRSVTNESVTDPDQAVAQGGRKKKGRDEDASPGRKNAARHKDRQGTRRPDKEEEEEENSDEEAGVPQGPPQRCPCPPDWRFLAVASQFVG